MAGSNALFLRQLARYGQDITLQNRDIKPPLFGNANFLENFTNTVTVKAIMKTERGKVFFDGVATERRITHTVKIAYLAGVTAETWILFNSRRLDILAVENCCEEDQVLLLTCAETGLSTKEASKL